MCTLLVNAKQLSNLEKSEGKYEMLPHTQQQPGMA